MGQMITNKLQFIVENSTHVVMHTILIHHHKIHTNEKRLDKMCLLLYVDMSFYFLFLCNFEAIIGILFSQHVYSCTNLISIVYIFSRAFCSF